MNEALQEAFADCRERNDLLSFVEQVQRSEGYLSGEAMRSIADLWGVGVGEVYSVATFYSFLSTRRLGRNVIKVCRSVPCGLKDYEMVLDSLHEELGISPGQMTADGRFSLLQTNCIGACDGAPAMMVNDEVYTDLTPERIRTIIAGYSRGSATA